MGISYRHCTVRLNRRQHERIALAAYARGETPSSLIRQAIEAFLAASDLMTSSQRRLARIGEFQQLALDVIIREQFPEFRERIVAETEKRLEQFHGAR